MLKSLIFVAFGGAIGASLRFLMTYWINNLLPNSLTKSFPIGILSVNIIGSLLIGISYVYFTEKLSLSDDLKLFIITGILGAFTTFSTFSLDTLLLIQQGSIMRGLMNIFFNVIICLMATWIGIAMTRNFT